jgi:ABC-type Fe3+ transport system permease subunit
MLGLVLAIMISQKYIKGKTFFRLTYFMPQIVSLVAVGIVWGWMYNPDFGIIGRVLSLRDIPNAMDIDFLGDENLVIWSLVVAGSWTCFGFNMVVFLAALQGIDNSYLEVALLEGANALQRLRLVIVPLIKSTVTLLVLNSLIGYFQGFSNLIYIMTKRGPYRSSEVIATYMFNAAFNMKRIRNTLQLLAIRTCRPCSILHVGSNMQRAEIGVRKMISTKEKTSIQCIFWCMTTPDTFLFLSSIIPLFWMRVAGSHSRQTTHTYSLRPLSPSHKGTYVPLNPIQSMGP